MAIQLKDFLNDTELSAMPATVLSKIERSINESIDNKIDTLEKENSKKFDSLVENLTNKFENKVSSVLVENVRGNASDMINKKFYGIIKEMVNLLEDAGIPTTEATKKLQQDLKEADTRLQKAYDERKAIKDLYNDNLKLVMIMNETKGMRPEIVDAAIEFFKNKDIREIDKDAIANFLDGDHSELFTDSTEDNQFSGEINLDQVKDALDEINAEVSGTATPKAPKLESLGKGLKQHKVNHSPDVSTETLIEAASMGTDELMENDTRDTLRMIDTYKGLGFNKFG